jgi:hypothetical protein
MPGTYKPPLPAENNYRNEGADINTAEVDVVTKDAYISSIRVVNTAATATTLTITDKATGATVWYDAISLNASQISNEQLPEDEELFCEGGFGIQASQAGLEVQIKFWTRPPKVHEVTLS